MAFRYKSADRVQMFLLPPAMVDWLPEDHLVWFVLDVVDLVDTSMFHERHRNDGAGRPAYDPEMMLALLVYAYCLGMRSSRRIEKACVTDVAFMVICGGLRPDHRSVAAFRANHEAAFHGVFCEILRLCAEAGLVTLGTIAVDGTKIAADASLRKNRSARGIAAEIDKILAEAADADCAVQPSLDGALPGELAARGSRRARLEAALAQIEAADAAAATDDAVKGARLAADAAQGRRPRGTKPKDPVAGLAHAEADLAAVEVRVEQAKSVEAKLVALSERERAQTAVAEARAGAEQADPVPAVQANTTDPESRIMKTAQGWLQGFNAQAAVTDSQIIVGVSLTNDANDVAQFFPILDATAEALYHAGVTDPIGLVLADAGYWSIDNATLYGPGRLIATQKDWKQRKHAQEMGVTVGDPPVDATPGQAMEHRLRTQHGAAAYAKRSGIIEPVFGQTKENRGIRRFMRRGLDATRSEWAIICATSNLNKLFTHTNQQPPTIIINPTQ